MKLTTHLHLVPRSIMHRAIPPSPSMPSWHGAQLKKAQGQLNFIWNIISVPIPYLFLSFEPQHPFPCAKPEGLQCITIGSHIVCTCRTFEFHILMVPVIVSSKWRKFGEAVSVGILLFLLVHFCTVKVPFSCCIKFVIKVSCLFLCAVCDGPLVSIVNRTVYNTHS